jgi:hypothetical protein
MFGRSPAGCISPHLHSHAIPSGLWSGQNYTSPHFYPST